MAITVAEQLLEAHRPALEMLCREYAVRRLELFGSATSDAFDPARSDFDLLVEFADPPERIGPLRQYFDFKEKLEKLYGRRVDLVEIGAIKKKRFFDVINPQRRLFYAA